MVQLSLMQIDAGRTLERRLLQLEERAFRFVEDPAHVRAAVRITADKFAPMDGEPLSVSDVRRVDAYFAAVLRRRILTSRDPAAGAARRRLVAASIEADLVQAGWSRSRARAEACRAVGEPSVA